jgi:hypothetical protein
MALSLAQLGTGCNTLLQIATITKFPRNLYPARFEVPRSEAGRARLTNLPMLCFQAFYSSK